jgi:hypothetical protein
MADVVVAPFATWIPDLDTVKRIEAHVVMPPGAKSLGEYTRNYQGITEGVAGHQRHRIGGQFILGGDRQVHLVNVFNVQPGKNCSTVDIDFDLDANRITRAECMDERP